MSICVVTAGYRAKFTFYRSRMEGLLNLVRGAANLGKLCALRVQHKIQFTERTMNKYGCNFKYNATCKAACI